MTIYNKVDIGTVDDDGTGDTLRVAFTKVNDNLTLLDTTITLDETASQPNPGTAKGRLWVRNDTPNVLVFTADDGSETVLGAGGGGGPEVNDLTSAVTWADVPDVNITESSVTQHQAALLNLSGLTVGWVLSADGATTASWKAPITDEKSYNQPGQLDVFTGIARWYPIRDITISETRANVGIPATNRDILINIKKNGTPVITGLIIAQTAYLSVVDATSITLLTTDYLTIDITQVGSSLPGQDLTINFKYN